jgi:hypothetical protein
MAIFKKKGRSLVFKKPDFPGETFCALKEGKRVRLFSCQKSKNKSGHPQ